MALQVNFTDATTALNVPAAYCRVERITHRLIDKRVEIEVASYVSQSAAQAGAQAYRRDVYTVLDPDYTTYFGTAGSGAATKAYQYLQAQTQFSGAVVA